MYIFLILVLMREFQIHDYLTSCMLNIILLIPHNKDNELKSWWERYNLGIIKKFTNYLITIELVNQYINLSTQLLIELNL